MMKMKLISDRKKVGMEKDGREERGRGMKDGMVGERGRGKRCG